MNFWSNINRHKYRATNRISSYTIVFCKRNMSHILEITRPSAFEIEILNCIFYLMIDVQGTHCVNLQTEADQFLQSTMKFSE